MRPSAERSVVFTVQRPPSLVAIAKVPVEEATSSRILDHDHVIWMGDLNYRIAEQLSCKDVLAHVK